MILQRLGIRWLALGTVLVGGAAAAFAEEPHWAFRRLSPAVVPSLGTPHAGRTPIDAFLQAKLHERELSFSPDADRVTLLRRAALDLVGLPPAPDEIDDFLSDAAPDAFERQLDRLIASPQFGERWARHWLDVVGYTDTVGFDIDANNVIMPDGKWRYRHYVIEAFNADKPYDRFVREQIAGDELVDWRHATEFTPAIRDPLIATGFLRTAQDFTHEPESNIELNRFAVLHDTLEIVGSSLLGLTLQCARCHDHKFDPVTQVDYYRLMALLTPAYNPRDWKPVLRWKPEIVDRGLPDVPPAELHAWLEENRQLEARIDDCQQRIAAIRHQRKQEMLKTEKAETSANAQTEPKITDDQVTAALTPDEQREIAELNESMSRLKSQQHTWDTIQALYDVGPAPETHLLERGDHQSPGEHVEPGFIAVLTPGDPPPITPPPESGESSGYRTALADWLTRDDTPASALLARVMANRLWLHLFGQGLVPTPENFGMGGEPPTHPELLEWLSRDLTRHDWRMKPLLRSMLASQAYRQTSRPPGELPPDHPDPGNRLLWRMPLRQLDAEIIRDSILSSAGNLTVEFGGPPVPVMSRPDGLVVIDESRLKRPADRNRRSIYLLFRRAYNLSLLTAFDQPFIATTCPQRNASAVVSQSLTMLNDEFLFAQSDHLAERVLQEAGTDLESQIARAVRLVLVRQPTDRERAWCRDFLADQSSRFASAGKSPDEAHRLALSQLCQALFNTSEFLHAE